MEAITMNEPTALESALFRALMNQHGWSTAQYMKAFEGFAMRSHVETCHPDRVDWTETQMEARITAAAITQKEDASPLVTAWVFGYRFRDGHAPAAEAAAPPSTVDGPPGAETREP